MLTFDDKSVLRNCTLFRALDPRDLDQVLSHSAVLTLSRNQQLFAQGDPATQLFVVIAGQIKLSRLAPNGDEAVVQVFGAGDSFAEAAMFMGGRYPVTASAISPSRLVGIASARLKAHVLERPEIAFAMMASMAQHLHGLVAQIEQMKLLTTRQRVIRFLIDQSGRGDGAASFELPHDKSLIANRLGMTPETFSRMLAQLADHGVAATGSRIRVGDVGRLAKLLGDC